MVLDCNDEDGSRAMVLDCNDEDGSGAMVLDIADDALVLIDVGIGRTISSTTTVTLNSRAHGISPPSSATIVNK